MRRFNSKAGSALIWALAVALILVIILAAGLGAVQRQQNANVQQHIENQAYFSAMSVTRAVMNWLDGASSATIELTDDAGNIIGHEVVGADDRNTLIEWILSQDLDPNDPEGFFSLNVSGMDFKDVLGEISLFASYNATHTEISIKAVAVYNDETSSVIGRLTSDSEQKVVLGGPTVAAKEVPPPPVYPEPGTVTTISLDTGNPTSTRPQDVYYTNKRTAAFSGSVGTLIVDGPANFSISGTIDLLIVRSGAVVQVGNALTAAKILIEDGGIVSFQANNAKIRKKGNIPACEVFVMPGGKLLNQIGSNQQAEITVYGYGTFDKDKIAVIEVEKLSNLVDIYIQPVEAGGYTADLGKLSSVSFSGMIHLPQGYTSGATVFNLQTIKTTPLPANVATNVCNKPGSADYKADEAPFCPHFDPLKDPTTTTTTESWGFAGFREG